MALTSETLSARRLLASGRANRLITRLLEGAGDFASFGMAGVGAWCFAVSGALAGSTPPLTFEHDIRPILKAECFQCHGEGEKLKGDLDLRLRHLIVKGGEDGTALVPGKPEKSLFFTEVRDGKMPKGEKKLSKDQVELIRKWVSSGAKTLRAEPAVPVKPGEFTAEEREYWAFQPITRPVVPKVRGAASSIRNPIDAFLLERLAGRKLSFSKEADRATLLRRATFDLTGLPPTIEEVDAFLADRSTEAYEKVIDRLLASPHYGEHWGRHWLDVAGYADSDGFSEADTVRKYAYKYRDYVIRSLNDDKPFDQFIREQLAGDEMLKPPYKNLGPDDVDKLVATGFLRMAPDGTGAGGVDQKVARNQVLSDAIKVVSTSLMGLTVGCAQCHNHRYDPIPQADYYRLRAIFEPAYDPKNWRAPNARLVSLMGDTDRAKAAEIEKEAAKIDAARLKKQAEFIDQTLEKELVKLPDDQRDVMRTAYKAEVKARSADQTKMLKEHPTIGQLSAGSLYLYNQKMADDLKEMSDEAGKVRATKPVEEFVAALTEPAGSTVPVTYLFNRGDPDQPKQAVKPGDLMILAALRKVEIPDQDTTRSTTGRRLAFAEALTDGKHPLTPRVIVNRVWLNHFGRGLVGTPGDFGLLGERPSHPELLDWLASEFVADGWSLKKLHKLIVMSAAYRQSSVRDAKKEKIDPDDRLLWRMPVRRLEAETLRDSMIAVSGKLNSKMFGQPVPVMEDELGQIVVGIPTNDTANRPTGKVIPLNGEEFRRSVYVEVRRSKPLGLLETFDQPPMEPNCDLRNASTVAPQSLALMNGEFAVAQSRHFAARVAREAGRDPQAQVRLAWRLAFGREPLPDEIKGGAAFIGKQSQYFTANLPAKEVEATSKAAPAKKEKTTTAKAPEPLPVQTPGEMALSSFCQALMSANRFLYID